jgi:hypothetical protein
MYARGLRSAVPLRWTCSKAHLNTYTALPIRLQRSAHSAITLSILSISPDGYIRLRYAELQAIPLAHCISGLDADGPALPSDAAMATHITGYTEWTSAGQPGLTLGWDWRMASAGGEVTLTRLNEPNSNIMLVDAAGNDLGPEASRRQLGQLVDALPWQADALRYLRRHFSGHSD